MEKPRLPSNEKKRLAALKSLNVLDTCAEERFDRITRMARKMFDVPIALVTLIDENRQWFKSCIGLDFSEGSRETSFCGHAILEQGIFVVPTASNDPRFFDNPMVIGEPYIEFYAGCPIIINGFQLGTLCILDNREREFDDDDRVALKDLTKTVEVEFSALQLASHDQLTGALNRRGFLSVARNILNLSNRNKFPVVLIYLDLNYFKDINDNFGHEVGDLVLESFADHLNHFFRDSDVVGRLGGDEFVVLLANTTIPLAEIVVKKLKLSVQIYFEDKKIAPGISFSSGIVAYEEVKHQTVEALLADTDKHMYHSKKENRK